MRRYRIGRAASNDIVVPDSTVSREHAELTELGDGRYAIKDLGSTYGTAVLQGDEWAAAGDAELSAESRLRLGEFETSVAELLRDADKTVVRAKTTATAPPRTAPLPERPPAPAPAEPPAPPAKPARTAPPTEVPAPPPRPAPPPPVPPQPPPKPARTAAPTEVPASLQRPAAPTPPIDAGATEVPEAPPAPRPPRPAPPRAPAPRPAPPRPASPRPASPPRPAGASPFSGMSQDKRLLLLLGAGFGAFVLIGLITLALVLALG